MSAPTPPTAEASRPRSATSPPASSPAWDNQTSTVTPTGRLSYSHYDKPWTGLPNTPRSGARERQPRPLVTSYSYNGFGRMTGKVLPNGTPARASAPPLQHLWRRQKRLRQRHPTPATRAPATTGPPTATTATPSTATTPASIATGCRARPTSPSSACSRTNSNTASTASRRSITPPDPSPAIKPGRPSTATTPTADSSQPRTRPPRPTQPSTATTPPATSSTNPYRLGGDDTAGTVSNSYDEAGRLTKTVDANGAQENLTYDEDGDITQRVADTTTFTSGSHPTTTYTYNDADQLTSETDPAGNTYHYYYDDRGNLEGTQYPNSTFSWSDTNPLGETTDALNRQNPSGRR